MTSTSVDPQAPRLDLEASGSRRTLLDGGWWPRSTDPVAELPGLIEAINGRHGPVNALVLSADGWDTHPKRLRLGGHLVRLGYFHSQPAALLTATCDNGDRIDLLVVPPDTAAGPAETAMSVAATEKNTIHAQDILANAGKAGPS